METDQERLDAAVKSNDGFFTTFAVSSYTKHIVKWAARRRLTPNGITVFSLSIAIAAAVCFATGERPGMVAGAVLAYWSFVFDCVDGQLARYTRQFSTLGAWLDATFDRAKEYVMFAGLAVGYGTDDIWKLAVAALVMQTFRHMFDFSYGASKRRRPPAPAAPAAAVPVRTEAAAPAAPEAAATAAPEAAAAPTPTPASAPRARGVKALLISWTRRTNGVAVFYWAKKMIVLPIGERFAVISITAAFFDARVTFLALLGWGAVALAYSMSGRLLRSFA